MNKLQKALLTNAIFSGISGLLLIFLHPSIAELFETTNTAVFWGIGIALIYFASTIIYEYYKQRTLFVKIIIAQDLLWVVGSIVLLIWKPFEISFMGNVLIGVVALIVLFMATIQLMALTDNFKSIKES